MQRIPTLFSAAFNAIAVTAAQDVFELVAPATSRILIHQIELGQYSDFGDAADEILSVLLLRGHTTSGSGGSTITPRNLETWGRASAIASVERNNTTIAADGTPHLLYATAFNVRAGFFWPSGSLASLRRPISLEAGDRFCVRITAPADEITLNGTLIYEETGINPA